MASFTKVYLLTQNKSGPTYLSLSCESVSWRTEGRLEITLFRRVYPLNYFEQSSSIYKELGVNLVSPSLGRRAGKGSV